MGDSRMVHSTSDESHLASEWVAVRWYRELMQEGVAPTWYEERWPGGIPPIEYALPCLRFWAAHPPILRQPDRAAVLLSLGQLARAVMCREVALTVEELRMVVHWDDDADVVAWTNQYPGLLGGHRHPADTLVGLTATGSGADGSLPPSHPHLHCAGLLHSVA